MTDQELRRQCTFRLRGAVDGMRVLFLLREAILVLGNSPSADLAIPSGTVSRRHATVSVSGKAVTVRDLASKNGTFVNGLRIEQARMSPGDWLQLGQVRLLLEEVEAEDAELAISITTPAAAERGGAGRQADTDTCARHPGREPAGWLEVLDAVLSLVGAGQPGCTQQALEELVDGLGAEGAVLIEHSNEREPLALACAGRLPPLGVLSALMRPTGDGARGIGDPTPGLRSPSATVELGDRDGRRLSLILLGDFPRSDEVSTLLRIVLRTSCWFGRQEHRLRRPEPQRKAARLRFPEWAVRGRSPAFRGLEDELLSLANTDIPVLITGETGTGKELVARTLHLSSERRRGPFVAVNCAAIPTDLLEADLFGVARGAATGVLERRGAFERASGGVLLLDEIGDMPLRLQAKLLRALQEKEILPVGGESPKHVDARVLSTTNSDIESQVEGGAFRRDLFFRLAGALVRVPSLAERQEDIPALVDRFVRQFLAESEKRIRGVTARTVHALAAARWPGNVRQLEHVVRRLVAVCPDDQVIDYGLLPPWVARAQRDTTSSPKTSLRPADPTAPVPGDASLAVQVEALERHAIASALERARGNRSLAARDLGLSRNGLTLKLRRLGLD